MQVEIEALASNDVGVRHAALAKLLACADDARVPLVKLLLDGSTATIARVWACIGLRDVSLDDEGVVADALMATLHSTEPALRWMALKAIAAQRLTHAVPAIRGLVNDDEAVPGAWWEDDCTPAHAARAALASLGTSMPVLPVEHFVIDGVEQLVLAPEPFVALIWDYGMLDDTALTRFASALATNHCVYAVCGGSRAAHLEQLLDVAHVSRNAYGLDMAELMVTTAHVGESREAVADFFMGCAFRSEGSFWRAVFHLGGTPAQQASLQSGLARLVSG